MEITATTLPTPATNPSVGPASDVAAGQASTATATDVSASAYAQNQSKVELLKATLNDTSGGASTDQQLEAFNSLNEMIVRGELKGMSHDDEVNLGKAMYETPTGKNVLEVQANFMTTFNAIRHRGTAENVIDQVKAYDTFSAPDRKVIFSTSINAPQLGGARPYADEADWRNVKAASYKLSKYVEDNRTSESDQSSPQNVQMQKALELLQSRQQDSGWAKQIADLFGGRGDIKDRIDLSPEAQKLVGDLSPKTTTSAPYVQGSIASKIA